MSSAAVGAGHLASSVSREIARLIDSGVYLPGSRLPPERTLAEMFNVSRVTIREALVSLRAIGRVSSRKGSGVYVEQPDALEWSLLPTATAFELTQARMLIESQAAKLAATNISQENLDHLDQLLEGLNNSQTTDEADLLDMDFHLTIARAAGNQIILRMVEWMWKMRTEHEEIKAAYHDVCANDTGQRGSEHEEVVRALRARNPERSSLAMRNHFRRLIESMLDISEAQALEAVRKQVAESRQKFLESAA